MAVIRSIPVRRAITILTVACWFVLVGLNLRAWRDGIHPQWWVALMMLPVVVAGVSQNFGKGKSHV